MSQHEDQVLPHAGKRKFPWLIGLILLALIGTVAYYSRSFLIQAERSEKKDQKWQGKNGPIAVVTAVAGQDDVPVYLNGLGTVTGLRTVTVRSRVDGELIKIAFKEGQAVQAGDLLAEIDPRIFQVQLRQAEGQLIRDEALLQNAETDLARYKTLLAEDSISAQQTVTQASLVKQYQGTVAIDRALVDNAKLQLSYTKVTAPINGRIGLRLVDQGNIMHASDTNGLAVITQVQPISVLFTLPEDALPDLMKKFQAGKLLTVDAYDRTGKVKLAQGSLLAVDNQIDQNTGTVKLKSQFSNDDGALFANQFVNVKMLVDTLKSVVTIPSAALQNGSSGTFVYVVQDSHTVSVRSVKLGPVDGEKVAILEGLQMHEAVVVDGADKLREGQQIKLIKREPVVEPNSKPSELNKAPMTNRDHPK